MMKTKAFGCIVLLVASVMVFSLVAVPEIVSAYTPTEYDLDFVDWVSDTQESEQIYSELISAACDRYDYDDIELYSGLQLTSVKKNCRK